MLLCLYPVFLVTGHHLERERERERETERDRERQRETERIRSAISSAETCSVCEQASTKALFMCSLRML